MSSVAVRIRAQRGAANPKGPWGNEFQTVESGQKGGKTSAEIVGSTTWSVDLMTACVTDRRTLADG